MTNCHLLRIESNFSNYETSRALWELCDGNKLTLTTCRRSEDTLFNMLKSENIHRITKSTFGNEITDGHNAYTNAKRRQINNHMMNMYVNEKKGNH